MPGSNVFTSRDDRDASRGWMSERGSWKGAGRTATSNIIGTTNTDPFFSNVVLQLFNENGPNSSTTFIDQAKYGISATATGTAAWSTTTPPTGATSSLFNTAVGDFVSVPDDARLEPGSSNFTIEGFIRLADLSASTVFTKRATSGVFAPMQIVVSSSQLVLYASSGGSWDVANAVVIGSPSLNTWYHWAVVRSGSTFSTYMAGTAGGTASSAATLLDNAAGFSFGASGDGTSSAGSQRQCGVRYTLGIARYSSNFTPPTLPLPTS